MKAALREPIPVDVGTPSGMLVEIRVLRNPPEIGMMNKTICSVSHDAFELGHVRSDQSLLKVDHRIEGIQSSNRVGWNFAQIESVVMDDLNGALGGVLVCKTSFEMFHRVRTGFDNIQMFCQRCQERGITSMTCGEIESVLKIEVLDEWPNQSRPLNSHASFRLVVISGGRAAECFDRPLRDFINVLRHGFLHTSNRRLFNSLGRLPHVLPIKARGISSTVDLPGDSLMSKTGKRKSRPRRPSQTRHASAQEAPEAEPPSAPAAIELDISKIELRQPPVERPIF